MNSIEHYQQRIVKELKDKAYGTNPAELYLPISYIMSLGGKRLRPVLVLMACDCFANEYETAVPAAIAIEVFHNFTLLHDDIMDNAPLRRNQPTVHEKWDSNIAILSGDAMMVRAYQELCRTKTDNLPALLEIFSDTAIKVCEGQQLDMNYEKIGRISVHQYIRMIELKTAALLGGALKIGSLLGNARIEDAKRMYEYGRHIGIGFQIMDDILDVYGDEETFGKQKGGDIIANKKTFLLIKAMEMAESNRYMKEELIQWLNAPHFEAKEKVQAVTDIYNFFKIKDLALAEIHKHYDKAIKLLNEIPLDESKKELFVGFAQQLMDRKV